jgi:C_GCAxxG_C_C family probable redox protein
MNHGERPNPSSVKGNCAQSTPAAFASDYGLELSLVLRSMAGFGAGVGGLRETCGAVSATAYVAGLHAGAYPPGDLAAKNALSELVKRMTYEFLEQHGTTVCRELLERAGSVVPSSPSVRSAEYYAARPCTRIVASAAEIIACTFRSPVASS